MSLKTFEEYDDNPGIIRFKASQILQNPDERNEVNDSYISEMKSLTNLMEDTLQNIEQFFGSSIIHGYGIDDITNLFKNVLKCSKNINNNIMTEVLIYTKMNPASLQYLKNVFIQQLDLKFIGWEDIVKGFNHAQQENLKKAEELLKILEKYISHSLFATGSVKAGVSATSSDYDFGFRGKFTDMKTEKQNLREKFNVPGFKLINCHYRFGRKKMIHLKLKNFDQIYEIDIVSQCTSTNLAEKILNLSVEYRIWIVALKLIGKRLCLIDTQNHRLSSCCLSVAVLCYLKEIPDPTFSSFLQWFGEFDFKKFQITDIGMIEKTKKHRNVEIIENGTNNTARSATFEVVLYCQKLFLLFSKWDDIGSYFFGMFFYKDNEFPKLGKMDNSIEIRSEACESITDIQLYQSHLKSLLNQTSYTLIFGDTIVFQNHTNGETLRRIRHQLNALKQRITDSNAEDLQEIESLFCQIQGIINTAVILGRMKATEETVYHKFLKDDVKTEIPVEDFNAVCSSQRRKNQEQHEEKNYTNTKFSIIVPSNYKCQNCLSNNHETKACSLQKPKCFNCDEVGHMSYKCLYQQCNNCCIYGHSRSVCPTKYLPSACFKCGDRDHLSINCPNSGAIFCYLCGKGHGMYVCPLYSKYEGKCLKHKGKHLYVNCDDYIEPMT